MPPAARQQFGDYLLLQLLGAGGMGSVYLARHVSSQQQVAIKVIAPHLAQSEHVAKRFEAEARAVIRIKHPNVIRIFDYGRLPDGTLYHVMEVLDGIELNELMGKNRRFSPAQALPYLRQICMGLQAAHDCSVVHRDLKPENIFVERGEPLSIKVLDFGIAKLLEPDEFLNLTATGVAIGTPMFIAPEQAMGAKEQICPQTDLYSLGVILYNMLCGHLPFRAEGIGALLAMHIEAPAPPLSPDVPEPVARVVLKCLEKEPALRHTSATALATAFERAVRQSAGRASGEARRSPTPGLHFEPRSTVPDEAADTQYEVPDAQYDGRDTIIDPRFQGGMPEAPTQIEARADVGAGATANSGPTLRDQVPPSVLLGQPAPGSSGRPMSHWLAMVGAIVGVVLIVLLLVLAVSMIGT